MKILGLARFKRKLAKMPKAAKDEIRIAIEKSAEEIVDLMRRLAPVDRGDLRDSIGWTWGAPPKGSSVLATSKRTVAGNAGLVATIYAGGGDAFHARWVEFGTTKMAAQPFFYTSWRFGKKRARSRITRATNKAAKRVAAGG
ncbi:MAG: HK97 gp10 family phage protein [Sphingomonas sp.]|nr:HK97 gp10 family phage protein [Sphingomonas sp.]